MKTPLFTGTCTAIVTPFDQDGINLGEFDRLLDLQLDAHVAAIVVCGTTGEAATLSDEEKLLLISHAISHVKGRCKIIAGTGSNDTAYSKCHVSYTNPETKETIEYTYTPRNAKKDGQTLEVNEKVSDKEEARKLAMKRLRQKNKTEFSAEFSLVGDVLLVAGVTVEVVGYGAFDGKYIIETATHNLTGGYTVGVKLRRVLEGY